MKLLKRIVIGLLALVLLAIIISYLLPRNIIVERSITINAGHDVVFEQVNNLKNLYEWNPWLTIDPEMKVRFSGPVEGIGAQYAWTGDDRIATGNLQITDSRENEYVRMRLKFHNYPDADADFTLVNRGGITDVTWAHHVDAGINPVSRWFGLFMDGQLGKYFEIGLQNLKTRVESLPVQEAESTETDSPAQVDTSVAD
jgi:hypothetical protein